MRKQEGRNGDEGRVIPTLALATPRPLPARFASSGEMFGHASTSRGITRNDLDSAPREAGTAGDELHSYLSNV